MEKALENIMGHKGWISESLQACHNSNNKTTTITTTVATHFPFKRTVYMCVG